MKAPYLKICGLKTLEDIDLINSFPISHAGFILAPSKRQISLDQLLYLRNHLRPDIKAVGVFVNENIKKINSIIKSANLDIVQLHGDEGEADCSNSIVPVWKTISIASTNSLDKLTEFPSAHGFLLDTYSPQLRGGTGKSFNWDIVKSLSNNHFIILAGGLNEKNICEAIKTVKPHVVDISSGVENKEKKDYHLIKNLIRRMKYYEPS